MLDSQNRAIYLDELRPPEGYILDCAIATTFTLDLLTLLMAPLSLALFDVENKDDILKDPLLVLEALRTTTDKLSIYCQNGYISVPKRDSLLYSYLENSVIPVTPKRGKGVFHPKTWALRYTYDRNVFYRFLCLSRNMTFDCSWDTIISLEGEYDPYRRNGYSKNKPLADFIQSLEELAVMSLPSEHSKRLQKISREMHKVQFNVPPGFTEDYSFTPSGISGYKNQTFPKNYDRAMVVSPFITDDALSLLKNKGENNILISRLESLDDISDNVYNNLIKNTSIYCLDDAALEPEDYLEESDEIKNKNSTNEVAATIFNGLHAKIFHFNHGWHSTFINGSANATKPGLNGGNVEFMVHLTGKRSKVGIEEFIGEKNNDENSFIKLLKPYKRYDKKPEKNEEENQAEKLLNEIKSGLLSLSLKGKIEPSQDKTYKLVLTSKKKIAKIPSRVTIHSYPITLSSEESIQIKATDETEIVFKNISIQAITTFIAFKISIKLQKKEIEESFVLNIPVTGIPEERNNSILVSIIKDRGRFIRYLLLILMENPDAFMLEELFSKDKNVKNESNDKRNFSDFEIPLLEELVRAFSRDPEKILRIAHLIDDIKKTDEAKDIIPLEFIETWDIFMEAYNERIAQ